MEVSVSCVVEGGEEGIGVWGVVNVGVEGTGVGGGDAVLANSDADEGECSSQWRW